MRSSLVVLSVAFATSAAGCNLDTAIFVDGTISQPSLTMETVLLGTKLGGGFDLSLHLGARASGASVTSIESFAVVDSMGAALVDPLALEADGPVANLTIEQDSTTVIGFTVSSADLVAGDVLAAVCGAGSVQLRGTFSDSLASAPTPVASEPFAPTGCP